MTKSTLFEMTDYGKFTATPPPRPIEWEVDDIQESLNELFVYCNCINDEKSKERIISFLRNAYIRKKDAYRLAKSFDDHFNSEGDLDLVNIMENIIDQAIDSLHKSVARWVKKYKFVPEFNVGEVVLYNKFLSKMKGEIYSICEDSAEYVIRDVGSDKKGGYLIPYENVISKA